MSNADYAQLGAVAVIFLFSIREFFMYLRSRKNGNGNGNGDYEHLKGILAELQTMNTNHLTHVQAAIEDGNRNLVNTIHSDNTRMIELLGEIKGTLSVRS